MPQCKSTTFQLAAIMWQKCPLREPQPPQRPQNPKRDTKPPQNLCWTEEEKNFANRNFVKRSTQLAPARQSNWNAFLLQRKLAKYLLIGKIILRFQFLKKLKFYIGLRHTSPNWWQSNGQIFTKNWQMSWCWAWQKADVERKLCVCNARVVFVKTCQIFESQYRHKLQKFIYKYFDTSDPSKSKKGQQFSCKLTFSILPQNPC